MGIYLLHLWPPCLALHSSSLFPAFPSPHQRGKYHRTRFLLILSIPFQPFPIDSPQTLHPALSVFLITLSLLIDFCLSSVQLLNCVQLFVTPWTAARQASLSITNSWSLLKLMSTASVMPSNHLILCCPLLLLLSIFSSIRIFSNESVLCIRWPKYWSFRFIISPSNEYSGLISFRMDWLDLLAV